MDGNCISDTTSLAYSVKKRLYVDERGIYTDGKYIAVALSNHYGNVGDRFKITLDTGNVIYAIMTDTKKSDELENLCTHPDGSMIEIIIDIEKASEYYSIGVEMGDFNYEDDFNGNVVKVERKK